MSAGVPESLNPLSNLDEWENFAEGLYREMKRFTCCAFTPSMPGIATGLINTWKMRRQNHAGMGEKVNPSDLYSKGHSKAQLKQLRSYYDDLFAEFLPEKLSW
jgi:hypothetical protein